MFLSSSVEAFLCINSYLLIGRDFGNAFEEFLDSLKTTNNLTMSVKGVYIGYLVKLVQRQPLTHEVRTAIVTYVVILRSYFVSVGRCLERNLKP